MSLSLRIALLNDAPLINQLGYSTYPFEDLWESKSELAEFLENEYSLPVLEKSLTDSDVCWLIAETDRPVGIAKLTWQSPISDPALTGTLLNKLYIEPDETGKGYGRIMVEEVALMAKARGQPLLWLQVLEQNVGARRFYASMGMQHIKEEMFISATQRSKLHIIGLKL
ncbi:GNAT family N-acetyltransferase [Rouxiella badensis]|uniref:GNAT family N-acetyltransferase n=1 Tax=Rouxiella badensis TaxID=1646377 RepID=UPI0013EF31E5|nr:GNAT family N-acetyltransferase [Rouxiella badensis]QII36622.1 GNAT family N-acetyltransferase [Rouxiella badensis]